MRKVLRPLAHYKIYNIDKRYLYIVYRKRNIYLKQNKRKKQKQNQFKKTDKIIKQKKL